jgi:hypothetical protein
VHLVTFLHEIIDPIQGNRRASISHEQQTHGAS